MRELRGTSGRVGKGRTSLFALIATTLFVSLALAQNPPAEEEQTLVVPPPSAAIQGPPLTGPEQIARTEQYLSLMQTTRRRVMGLLDESRRARDIIKATCLNDKLTQINGNMRVAEERSENLQQAVRSNDDGRRNHEFIIVTVVRQKVDALGIEADACVGEERWYTGATRIETRIDPDIPEEDTAQVEIGPYTLRRTPGDNGLFERPPSASGYY